jgi:hypothetical protein
LSKHRDYTKAISKVTKPGPRDDGDPIAALAECLGPSAVFQADDGARVTARVCSLQDVLDYNFRTAGVGITRD